MTTYSITKPERLQATIKLPASKSISNRALIIYALSGGKHLPQNLSDCDDTEVIINALRFMPKEINIKAAGTAMRFMTAYLSVMRGTHILTGTERMQHRPIGILVDAGCDKFTSAARNLPLGGIAAIYHCDNFVLGHDLFEIILFRMG